MRPLRPLLALAALSAGLLGTVGAAAAARPVPTTNPLVTSGPRLRTPVAELARSLVCRGDVAHAVKTPVLLLHGTGSTSEESWGPVYVPQLLAAGHPVCTVQLPDRATTDMQRSTEPVVHAIRAVAALRHGRVDVVGHSQGATLAVTALKFWPDLPGLVEDYIGLAPTLGPGVTGDVMCLRPCSAPFQQRRSTSVYFADVSKHPLPAGPSYTTIATLTDEIATPEPQASHLDGATNVVVQDRCPGKVVDHFGLVSDGTVFALVTDGLEHDGPVDLARIATTDCLAALPPGTDAATVAPLLATAVANDLAANGSSAKLDAEPAVRCYVMPTCTDVTDRGRLLAAVRRSGRTLTWRTQAPGTLRVALPSGRTLVVPLEVGRGRLVLPAGTGRVRLLTATPWYVVPAVEAVLP